MAKKRDLMFVSSARIIGIVLLSLFVSVGYAHEEEIHKTRAESVFHQFNTTTVIALTIVAILACTIMLLTYNEGLDENQKKIIFGIIVIAAVVSTGYLVGNTVYMSLTSWSKGLIHWHADFEIWICGEKIVLPDPTGIANRVGTAEVHHHGDYRIHLEGVVKEREDATLGHFFDAIGVAFSNEKILNIDNGNYCPDGKKGNVKMFVNGKLYEGNYRDYVIAPYSQVPPGDFIKIVFE